MIKSVFSAALALLASTLFADVAECSDIRNSTAVEIRPFVDRHQLAGAVTVIVSKNRLEKFETAGFADVDAQRNMQPNTVFWLGSTSKPLLAAAILMLVDEGRVSLNDPVEKYIPTYKPSVEVVSTDGRHVVLKRPDRPPTVRNLLTHTGGTRLLADIEHRKIDSLSLSAKVDAFSLEPLLYGERCSYPTSRLPKSIANFGEYLR